MALSDREWKKRVLCSDGNCIGVVGADGRCKVCGLPYEGKLPDMSDDDFTDEKPSETPQAGSSNLEEEPDQPRVAAPSEKNGTEDAWASRTLCIDESCIGIIGPDGKCKECGIAHPEKTP